MVDAVMAAIRHRHAFTAKLFLTMTALVAFHTTVDHTADRDSVPGPVSRNPGPDSCHTPYDFMTRNNRINRHTPVVTGHMHIGMANTAIQDFHGNIIVAKIAALERIGNQRRIRRMGSISDCFHGKPHQKVDNEFLSVQRQFPAGKS